LPPAPGLFSTTMFQPVSCAMAVPIMRVSVSVPPPGGKGEISVIGAEPMSAAPAAADETSSVVATSSFFRDVIVFLTILYGMVRAALFGAGP
jgi:hypothetical protein